MEVLESHSELAFADLLQQPKLMLLPHTKVGLSQNKIPVLFCLCQGAEGVLR